MSSTLEPSAERDLAARAAEMLGLPQMVCGYRRCRRARACIMRDAETLEPCCVDDLDDEQRLLYKALCDETRHVLNAGIFDPGDLIPLIKPAPSGVSNRWLRDLAIATSHTLVNAGYIRQVLKFLATREQPSSPMSER